ncbi:MAG TPA: hypothetical protein VLA44_02625 [Clostridia bacterium]|nr:hypothetical protein [Clostridia bacterium]
MLSLTTAVAWWRGHRRAGSRFVNDLVNPFLLRRGVPGRSRENLGTIEHIGRRSGIRRLTLVHPVPTDDGFRILVPLGTESEWARNVLAAGHCRMQVGDIVYELDEPALVPIEREAGVPAPIRWAQAGLGFMSLRLRRFAAAPGTLDEPVVAAPALASPAEPERVAVPG